MRWNLVWQSARQLLHFLPALLVVSALALLVFWPRAKQQQAASGTWTCSMHPQVRSDQPGQCPLCGMDLIPVAKLDTRRPQAESRAGIETASIERRALVKEIRTVARIDYNETHVADISARIAGRVERLYVDFVGTKVRRDDHLVDIYSPELIVAQEELLRALAAVGHQRNGDSDIGRTFAHTNVEAARDKLRLWGILPAQIEDIEATRQLREHITLFAPMAGTVVEKNVRAGQYIEEGDLLYRIADLDPIWVYLDIYEYDIAWIQYGQVVEITVEALPGETLLGRVSFIDPFLNEGSRTVKVRVTLPNPQERLKPGMYASATVRVPLEADGGAAPTGLEGQFTCPMHPEVLQEEAGRCPLCDMELVQIPREGPFAYAGPGVDLGTITRREDPGHTIADEPPGTSAAAPVASLPLAVPASAVLDTGRRQVVYRLRSDGGFELVKVILGPRATGDNERGAKEVYFAVLAGLNEGDKVAVRGGFLLDSQRQLEGMPSLFFPAGAAPSAAHAGHGAPAEPQSGAGEVSTEHEGHGR